MTLNADLVRARCAEIEDSVSRLERFARRSRDEFLTDQDALDVACYRLLVAIEASLALCYHVSAKRLHKVPEEYAACFGLLRDAGVIADDLTGRLQQMARFCDRRRTAALMSVRARRGILAMAMRREG